MTTEPDAGFGGQDITYETEDTRDLVSNAMLQRAVLAHLKMPDWVPVTITEPADPAEPGKWSIRTTDIAADGQWYLDGRNTDGSPHIDILMEEMVTKPAATSASTTDWVDELDGGVKVTRGKTTDKDAIDDDPSDDDVVELGDRMTKAAGHWAALQERFNQSIRYGDPGLLSQAQDEIPMLVQSLMLLTTTMNRAIRNAE